MKTKIIFAILLFAAGALSGILLFRQSAKPVETPQRLSLEQILTIKELHLVRHTYQDLFFLHKDNNKNKPVRAIVRVPVTITAFIDLKKIKIVHERDSVKQVVLPRATLNVPLYRVDEMVITKTRAFQLHAGEDLYPAVTTYLGAVVAERIKVVNEMALAHDILLQAEAEAKAYVEWLLRSAGYQHVVVTFGEEGLDKKAEEFLSSSLRPRLAGEVPAMGHKRKSLETVWPFSNHVTDFSLRTFLPHSPLEVTVKL